MNDLDGKLAVVSGGARDIGRAVVVELVARGAEVVFGYNRTGPDQTLGELAKAERKARAVPLDATSAASVSSFIEHATTAGRKIDILVNVTGGLVARKRMEEMDEAFWDQVIDLNVKSSFLLTKAVLQHMPEGGSIVNFASQAGRDGGGPGAIAYATAKGAIMTFTRALAKELGPRKIRVNAVCPGMISTTFHDSFTKPEVRQRVAGMTPLGREGQSAEVGRLVAYLASSGASFINGACIDINGGLIFS